MVLQQQIDQKHAKRCIIAGGSNLSNEIGASVDLIEASFGALSSVGLFQVEISRFFRTPAFPKDSGPDFVNAAVLCEAELTPGEVLATLHRIEHDFGRTRSARWEARVIDLDLIDYDAVILPEVAVQDEWRKIRFVLRPRS